MSEPLCYKCKYRKGIAGDSHSECNHPKASFYSLIYVMSLPELTEDLIIPPLDIKANINGIKKGWFMWPLNFDPIWLIQCKGFEKND